MIIDFLLIHTMSRQSQSFKRQFRDNSQFNYNRRSKPVLVIPSINLLINSFQVGSCCARFWKSGQLGMIQEILNFFIDLRKSIMKTKLQTPIKLNEVIARMIENEPFVAPKDTTKSWFAVERTTVKDVDQRNYDFELWSKFFIMMLPPCDVIVPRTIPCFHLLCDISQQINESEIAAYRLRFEEEAEKYKQMKLNELEEDLEQGKITQDDYEDQKDKIEAMKNEEVWEKQKKLRNEIWTRYDEIKASANDTNINDDNDIKLIYYWRFITRNPCFPFPILQIGSKIIPAQQFALQNAFQYDMETFTNNFADLRKWYYSIHPTIDSRTPKTVEIADWLRICLPFDTSEHLASFIENPISISSLSLFDDKYFNFCLSCSKTTYNQQCSLLKSSVIVNGETKFVDKSENVWRTSSEVFPYISIRLNDKDDMKEIMFLINKTTEFNCHRNFLLLKAYEPNIVLQSIGQSLSNGFYRYGHVLCRIAQNLHLNLVEILKIVEQSISKSRFNDERFYCLAPIILTIGENFDCIFKRVIKGKNDEDVLSILHGFELMIPHFEMKCAEIKPLIILEAQRIMKTSDKPRLKYMSIDVIESFENLQNIDNTIDTVIDAIDNKDDDEEYFFEEEEE